MSASVCVNMFVEPISVKRQSKPVFNTVLPAPCSICFAMLQLDFRFARSFVRLFYLLSNNKRIEMFTLTMKRTTIWLCLNDWVYQTRARGSFFSAVSS